LALNKGGKSGGGQLHLLTRLSSLYDVLVRSNKISQAANMDITT